RLRKYVMKTLLQKFPYLRFGLSKFIQNPEIMGEDFARFLAISMPVSQTFGYIYEAIDTGNIDWLDKNIHLLLKDDYPPGSSYTNIEDDMKLETKYLGNEPLPLTLAIKARPSDHRHEIIKWLIELGFDVNARDRVNDGRTPLMEAVRQNDLETVKLIRKAGEDQKIQIDLFERDDEGASAFDLAESNPAIQEYLEAWASHWAENVLREGDASPDTISGFDGWEDSDDVAIPGTVWLIAETDPEFKGEDFERKVTDVTWKQLADEIIPAIIATTGNDRHVFLEELQKIKYEVEPGVPSYYVDMVDMIS
ncbi:MAG: ankyrin repeat domain-containing protein, partial [Gammaproteobacteria bacterium]|nr:ankyrin repeat domain-containing protein [Gammaproteobacteria bacterium]